MWIKTGEIIVETLTGREYVIEEVTEPLGHITERWIGFRNLRTRNLYAAEESQILRDFGPKTSQ